MKKALAIFTPCITLCVALMLALSILASMFWEDISLWLYGRAQSTNADVLSNGYALCEEIVEEGVVLLKNEEDSKGNTALPLSKEEINAGLNVFGWAAYDWMTMAFGSGYANTDLPRTKLFPALKEAGIKYNEDLYKLYQDYYTAHSKTYGDGDYLEYRGGVAFGSEEIFVLREPGKADYEKVCQESGLTGVGLVVIGRTGSESKDLQLHQVVQTEFGKNTKQTRNDRHYLQLSKEEEDMIEVAKTYCDKVIVILNTANTMETGFIEDAGIDGALLVGITGLSGVNGLINVLKGEKETLIPERDEDGNVVYEKEAVQEMDANGQPVYDKDGNPVYAKDENGDILYKDVVKYKKDENGNLIKEITPVSPSGRTADTYAYDIIGTTPAAVDQNDTGAATKYTGSTAKFVTSYVDYAENIYVGYKWFETADAEKFWDGYTPRTADNISKDKPVKTEYVAGKTGYKAVVQYPFGYGLSYTKFEWNVVSVKVNGSSKSSGALNKDDKIEIVVNVKNTGDRAGADVVELYYTAPYQDGGIEKASVNLIDFKKTAVIPAGETGQVTLSLTVQSMASYDCYDLNGNGHTGYELDEGEYTLSLMKDSHNAPKMSSGSNVIKYSIPKNGYNYDTDSKTGEKVENRFTNKDGSIDLANNKVEDLTIDKADLDGSMESTPVKYLSRADFKGTYPVKEATGRAVTATAKEVAQQSAPTQEQLEATGYGNVTATRQTETNSLKFNDLLEGVEKYDDPLFAEVIKNITNAELVTLIQDAYFKTAKIASIEKDAFVDLDGPLGFNTRVTGGNGTTCSFMAYPNGTTLAQTWNPDVAYKMGISVGSERLSMKGLRGWYAPGADTHRNPFGGRNGEYYSEDGVLAGKICAQTVRGAKDMGVYSYVKHFVLNDSELDRSGLFTFITEQALRENYLKPFEIMIKDGGGNALMSAMNRVGRVWSGANYGLMTEIVRNEWGFNGTVVTDWCNTNENYMPLYRGIWAGSDIWLSNGVGSMDPVFNEIKCDTAYKIAADNVAHHVLWTFVDTYNANMAFDPANAGTIDAAEFNMTWIAYVVIVDVALAAGAGVMGFFLARSIIYTVKNGKAPAATDGEPLPEGGAGGEPPTDGR